MSVETTTSGRGFVCTAPGKLTNTMSRGFAIAAPVYVKIAVEGFQKTALPRDPRGWLVPRRSSKTPSCPHQAKYRRTQFFSDRHIAAAGKARNQRLPAPSPEVRSRWFASIRRFADFDS